jgi:predicted site-specific integrase-resolvase
MSFESMQDHQTRNPVALLSESDVADLLGVTPHTLAVWRSTKRVPLPYVKLGRCVRYRREDVEAFVAGQRVVYAEAA